MEAKTMCGGHDNTDIGKSCLTLTSPGTWERTTTLLKHIRRWHSSWNSPSGLMLFGGHDSRTTSEKIKNGTSSASFDLKYSTAKACAINLRSSVIINGGGTPALTTVSQ